MDESLQRDCYFAAIDAAGKAGLKHYEISNFALPGWECKHNLGYWTNEGYLGIGPGAGSYVVGVRRTNRPDLKRYIQAVLSGYEPPGTWEHLTDRPAMGEAMILGLRLTQGVDRKSFACRFGVDPLGVFPQTIARYAEQNLLVVTPSHVRLGKEGLFVADTILGDILSEL
jgi:oxygen-independent coproporphyrinogen-3 oxidase